MRINSHPDLGIGPVTASKGNIDQHLAETRHRIGKLGKGKLFGPARGMDDDGFHGSSTTTRSQEVLQLQRQSPALTLPSPCGESWRHEGHRPSNEIRHRQTSLVETF